jgi:hypothetical protein
MRGVLLALVLATVAGCSAESAQPTATPTTRATPASPAFELATVKASFTDECKDPIVVDDLFCEQVQISHMTAEGSILQVPTTLNAAATDRARAICDQVALAHFDGATGNDLGYHTVGILDMDGGNVAACTVR